MNTDELNPQDEVNPSTESSETNSPVEVFETNPNQANFNWITEKVSELRKTLGEHVIGQHQMVELMMAGILSNGHLLLEGAPGIAKTLSAKVMSKSLDVKFSRIQFTPDLMPTDVIGTSVFNMKESSFSFKQGPIFANIVLIDEINRAPAKTQAALFEVMEERQITNDGVTYELEFPFLILATQNPVEQEGTYNLPEAQLDRFLFKIKLDYPVMDEEVSILQRYKSNKESKTLADIVKVFTPDEIKKIQSLLDDVRIEDSLVNYIAALIVKTRNHEKIYLGASPRASLAVLKSSKAIAAMRGRDFVTPDDIKFVLPHVLNHRLILTPEAEMEGLIAEDVIAEIVKSIEVPR
jgi:MoxR-like ATPase